MNEILFNIEENFQSEHTATVAGILVRTFIMTALISN